MVMEEVKHQKHVAVFIMHNTIPCAMKISRETLYLYIPTPLISFSQPLSNIHKFIKG